MTFLISPTEPKALKDCLDCISSSDCEEWGADIAFFFQDGKVLVQRKTVSDFVASIKDGRLRKEISQLQCSPYRYLLLEGRFQYKDNKLVVRKKRKEVSSWTKEQIEKLKYSIAAKGISLLYSDSLPDTAQKLKWLADWYSKDKHISLESRGTAKSGKWPYPNYEDEVRFFYQGIPGFSGAVLSKTLVQEYPVPELLYQAALEELKQLPGFGDLRARKIVSFLKGEKSEML